MSFLTNPTRAELVKPKRASQSARDKALEAAHHACRCTGHCGRPEHLEGCSAGAPQSHLNVIVVDGQYEVLCVSCRMRFDAPSRMRRGARTRAARRSQQTLAFVKKAKKRKLSARAR